MPRAARDDSPPFRMRVAGLVPEADSPSGPAAEEEAESLRLMVRAAKAEPHDPDYFHILAGALLRAGKVGDALGAALVRLGREGEAVPLLKRGLKIDPHDADAHSNLGAALWGAGDQAEALRCFRRAVRLDPDDVGLVRNLALARRAHGRASRAVRVLQKAVVRWPRGAELRVQREDSHPPERVANARPEHRRRAALPRRAGAHRPLSRRPGAGSVESAPTSPPARGLSPDALVLSRRKVRGDVSAPVATPYEPDARFPGAREASGTQRGAPRRRRGIARQSGPGG